MILTIFGTTGELIKLAPVLVRLQEDGHPLTLATTGQQVTQIPAFLEQFGLPQPDIWLGRGARGRDLATNRDIPGWLGDVSRSFVGKRGEMRRRLRGMPGEPLVLVHGDTMTTVIAAGIGRALRVPVAHIEGGLRSGDLRNPFPEEMNRRMASRLAAIHYAPGAWAAANLLGRGTVVDTGCNTVRDSLALVPHDLPPVIEAPDGPFGIVSLHRFELLRSRELLTRTIRSLADAAQRTPMLFVDHPVTAAAIRGFGLDRLFSPQLRRIPRLRFFDFVQLERRCSFVVTDSGGSQEECFYLDRPCLVHRLKTERHEGLGQTTVLSHLEIDALDAFLDAPGRHRRSEELPLESPTEIIVDDLARRGFVGSSGRQSV
jgi:UDP-N-acetylglucosamine 2-epimerase (non-hydrolysing)